MRTVGAFLIILSSLYAAIAVSNQNKNRLQALRSLSFSLKQLRGELSFRGSPLGDAIRRSLLSSKGAGKKLLETVLDRLDSLGECSFSEIWNTALHDCSGELKGGELETLEHLGLLLGRFDLELQLQELDSCISFLERELENGLSVFPLQRRLIVSLLLCSGAFLVILIY